MIPAILQPLKVIEVDTIECRVIPEGQWKCWKHPIVFGAFYKDGSGFSIIPCPEERPPLEDWQPDTTWVFGFCGWKGSVRLVKQFAITAWPGEKKQALERLALRAAHFGFIGTIEVFSVDPPVAREDRKPLRRLLGELTELCKRVKAERIHNEKDKANTVPVDTGSGNRAGWLCRG